MSNDSAWKHLNLDRLVMTSHTPKSSLHSHDIDYTASGSYDSILIPSNVYTPTLTSTQNTPTHSNFIENPAAIIPSHSASQSASYSLSYNSHSHTTNSKPSKKKDKTPEKKFASDFIKKSKMISVMRGSRIVGPFEAKLMLSYFRNVEIAAIDSTDMALRYLESKSVRTLKRSLREMNETIRRTFYYGADFTATHEQHLLGNDTDDMTHNHEPLTPITEHLAAPINSDQLPNITTVINLGDLTNASCESLDDYLQSPNTTYTPAATVPAQQPIADMDIYTERMERTQKHELIFDPLKGAQNIKPDTPLNFKKNYGKKHVQKQEQMPSELPHIEEKQSYYSKNGRTSAATKMFGKYFDKRGSNISHGSIWSESITKSNNAYSDDVSDCYILTQFDSYHSDDDECMKRGVDSARSTLQLPIAGKKKKKKERTSFASTVSLGSAYTVHDPYMERGSTILPIEEEQEEIAQIQPNGKVSKRNTQRKYNHNMNINHEHNNEEIKTIAIKILRIDSLLLDPENQPTKHDINYSLDSFLSDMVVPEPSAMEKLKYHLTEPRLPPDRRKTYNYG